MQANGSGGGYVEGFFTTGLGDAQQQVRHVCQCGLYALAFVPQYPGAGMWQGGLMQHLLALQVGDQ